jgi:hypothetical protein
MNYRQTIEEAVRQHAPVSVLRELHQAETHAQLQYENELAHSVGMDIHALSSLIDSMAERAGRDDAYSAMLKDSLPRLCADLAAIQSLVEALQS